MKNGENWRVAYSYAYKCSPWIYRDLVHEAWLYNYNKDQTDLMEKTRGYMLRLIKWMWLWELRRHYWEFMGQKIPKSFLTIKEDFDENEHNTFYLVDTAPGADRMLMSKEFIDEFNRRIETYSSGYNSSIDSNRLKDCVNLFVQGFTGAEIATEMGLSTQLISTYKKKIREIIDGMQIIEPKKIKKSMAKNPFSGDKTIVRGVVTEKVWRTRKNKPRREKYEQVDYNEYYELYRHIETGVGLLVRLKDQKINPYLLNQK